MRKLGEIVLSMVLAMSLLLLPSVEVYRADPALSMSVDKDKVIIGSKINVTIAVPDGYSATVDIKYPADLLKFEKSSTEAQSINGKITTNLIEGFATSTTLTFTSLTAGTANIEATVSLATQDGELPVQIAGASTSVTIENQAPPEPEKSNNNYISSIKVMNGSQAVALSPALSHSEQTYRATVGNGVTNVKIAATAEDSKASLSFSNGTGNMDLKVGENKIYIHVKAENGETRGYTIIITREAATTVEPPKPTETETEPPSPSEPDFTVNDLDLYIPNHIPETKIPADFEAKTITLNGKDALGLSFKNGSLTVLYMEDEEKTGALYVYNEKTGSVYPFVKLEAERHYTIVLEPDAEVEVPTGFKPCTLPIEGKGVVQAFQYQVARSNVNPSDFYLLYCINQEGQMGWYQYDSLEGTYQRYVGNAFLGQATDTPSSEPDSDTQAGGSDNKGDAGIIANDDMMRLIVCVAIFVAAVIAVIIINLIIFKRRKSEEFQYEEDEEEDEKDYEEEASAELPVKKNPVKEEASPREEDEDIEFVEL